MDVGVIYNFQAMEEVSQWKHVSNMFKANSCILGMGGNLITDLRGRNAARAHRILTDFYLQVYCRPSKLNVRAGHVHD